MLSRKKYFQWHVTVIYSDQDSKLWMFTNHSRLTFTATSTACWGWFGPVVVVISWPWYTAPNSPSPRRYNRITDSQGMSRSWPPAERPPRIASLGGNEAELEPVEQELESPPERRLEERPAGTTTPTGRCRTREKCWRGGKRDGLSMEQRRGGRCWGLGSATGKRRQCWRQKALRTQNARQTNQCLDPKDIEWAKFNSSNSSFATSLSREVIMELATANQ